MPSWLLLTYPSTEPQRQRLFSEIYSIFPEMYTQFYFYLMHIICSLGLFRCDGARWYNPPVTSGFPSVRKTIALSYYDVTMIYVRRMVIYLSWADIVNEIPKVWFYCMAISSSISEIALIRYLLLLIHLKYTSYKCLVTHNCISQ